MWVLLFQFAFVASVGVEQAALVATSVAAGVEAAVVEAAVVVVGS